MDPTQKCFCIEREGDLPNDSEVYCMANFKDEFVFLFPDSSSYSYRYSLTEDKWEALPWIPIDRYLCACSLGDKVYVLSPKSRIIKVLHGPGAPVSSREMHWQDIEVPGDVPIPSIILYSHHSTRLKLSSQGVGMKTSGRLETF